jgi:hypothetical protein
MQGEYIICKIADLIAQIPTADGLAVRCKDYLWDENAAPDITVHPELYRPNLYPANTPQNIVAYMEAAAQFYRQLLSFDGFYLHASAVVKDGKAYLFSGNSGAGKSTHTHLWVDTFGGDTRIINDDKPALRLIDGTWYAYGTPWCGKNSISLNECAPVAGICFMKKAPHNRIRRMPPAEALQRILGQTMHRMQEIQYLDALLAHLEKLLARIPVYELENLPEPAAARLSYETMLQGALNDEN